MKSYETDIQSFIIRIWVEKSVEARHLVWSGTVTHVPSGKQYSFKNIGLLMLILIQYMELQGIRGGLLKFLLKWFSHW